MTLLSDVAGIGNLGLAGIPTTILGTTVAIPVATTLASAVVSGTLGAGASTLGATTVTTLGGTGALSGFTTGSFSSTLDCVTSFTMVDGNNTIFVEGRTDGGSLAGTGAANISVIDGIYASNPIAGARIAFAHQGSGGQRGGLTFASKNVDDDATQPTVYGVLTPAGNWGFGTTNPSYKVEVAGTLGVTGAVTADNVLAVGTGFNPASTGADNAAYIAQGSFGGGIAWRDGATTDWVSYVRSSGTEWVLAYTATQGTAAGERLTATAAGVSVTGTLGVTGLTTLSSTVNALGSVNLLSSSPTLSVGSSNVSTGNAGIEIGQGRTGDGFSFLDFVGDTTYTDYGLRIERNGTANGASVLRHRGTGDFTFTAAEAANVLFQTSGTTALTIASTGAATFSSDVSTTGFLNFGALTTTTIASGAITATRTHTRVATEGGAASDDLITINGGSEGDIIILLQANGGQTVNVNEGGNMQLASSTFALNSSTDTITLLYEANTAVWVEVSRSDNA